MKTVLLTANLAMWVLVSGCAPTTRAPSIEKSGFLSDYSILKPGGKDEAQRVYRKPDMDWASYKNILLDPVTIWTGKESQGKGISAQDSQTLANYFHSAIYQDLNKEGFRLVDAPKPHTLRVQVAITKAKESNVALNVISSVVPQLRALSSLDKLATGKPAFVGEAQIEVKVTDAITGELLVAGVDHRVGGKVLNAAEFSSWGDVETMMREWAGYGSYNLCKLQGRSNCVPPKVDS